MILESLHLDPAELERRTGWAMKPEGACKGEVCVPVPGVRRDDGTVDATVLAERLGMPLVAEPGRSLWALGPETAVTGRALTTAQAPDLVLPDLDGRSTRIADLRPQKVVLVAWASW